MRCPLLGVIFLVALAGCGGGSDSEDGDSRGSAAPSAGAQRTSAEFVRRVDAVCEETNPELAKLNAAVVRARDARRAGRASQRKTFAVFATLLRRASATTQRFATRLRAIEAPGRDRAFYDDLTNSVDEGYSNLRRQVSAAEAQDAIELRDLSVRGSVINARGKGLFAGHGGFRFCGRG